MPSATFKSNFEGFFIFVISFIIITVIIIVIMLVTTYIYIYIFVFSCTLKKMVEGKFSIFLRIDLLLFNRHWNWGINLLLRDSALPHTSARSMTLFNYYFSSSFFHLFVLNSELLIWFKNTRAGSDIIARVVILFWFVASGIWIIETLNRSVRAAIANGQFSRLWWWKTFQVLF